jgi:hypothetical protein
VVDPRAAAEIVARAGLELWGQDIRLRAAPLHRLRGVVLDGRGDAAPGVTVKATRAGDFLVEETDTVSADNGSFEFSNLYDGEWSLSAEAEASPKLRAATVAQVSGRDVDRAELRLAPPFTLRGSVDFGPQSQAKAVVVFLRPSIVVESQGLHQAPTARDGAFKIDNVYPGSYKIFANSPGSPYFLASLTIGDREALGQYVELDSGTPPVKVLFDSSGGGARGTVENCGGATVVLAPQDKTLYEPQFVQTASCAEGGRFEIPSMRPGAYCAFAFDQWDGPVALLSSLDQAPMNTAVSLRVNRGEVANVDLRVTPFAPRAPRCSAVAGLP